MKPLTGLTAAVVILVMAWFAHRLWTSQAGHEPGRESVPSSIDTRGSTQRVPPPAAGAPAAIAVSSPTGPPAPRPSITPAELDLKISMLRRDLEGAKNDGHRMFILRRIAENCTKAGSFVQCGKVLEGVSDLVTEPALTEELKGMVETMKKRASGIEEKSGSRDRSRQGWGETPVRAA